MSHEVYEMHYCPSVIYVEHMGGSGSCFVFVTPVDPSIVTNIRNDFDSFLRESESTNKSNNNNKPPKQQQTTSKLEATFPSDFIGDIIVDVITQHHRLQQIITEGSSHTQSLVR
jgi:hypothetical protein